MLIITNTHQKHKLRKLLILRKWPRVRPPWSLVTCSSRCIRHHLCTILVFLLAFLCRFHLVELSRIENAILGFDGLPLRRALR